MMGCKENHLKLNLSQIKPVLLLSAVKSFKSFEHTVGKGEIAQNEQFLLFPQCFLPFCWAFNHFDQIYNCGPQTYSVWKSLEFVVWESDKMEND